MKKSVIFSILLSILSLSLIRAQVLDYFESELNTKYIKKEYDEYILKLIELQDKLHYNKDTSLLSFLQNKVKLTFDHLNHHERKLLRKAAMMIAQETISLTGNFDKGLEIYLISHENVENKHTLDSLAWYVENKILNIYSRKNEYEKAEYFSNLVEASLRHFGMIENLTRFYANKGIKLKSELKVDEAIKVFEEGYRLADSIRFSSGCFANAYNLAVLYNEYPDYGSPERHLTIASTTLDALSSDPRLTEKRASLDMERAKLLCMQDQFAEGISLFAAAIDTLAKYFSTTGRREFAKYYTSMAEMFLNMGRVDQADSVLMIGIACLIPGLKNNSEFPVLHNLYPENSFIDLFELKASILEQKYQIDHDINYLEKALKSIEYALYANDLIRETVVADPSKLLSIQSNRSLIEQGINILYHLYSIDGDSSYLLRVRNLFNRSKSLLYNEKTIRNNIFNVMTSSDRDRWMHLQKQIADLHDKKQLHPDEINAIDGEILNYQEQIHKIFSPYENIPVRTRIPDNYIEYVVDREHVFAMYNLNDKDGFIELGKAVKFDSLRLRLNEYILLRGMSMDEGILNEMYDFLIGPLSSVLPEDIVIIPDGAIGFVPFEMLMDPRGKYLIESCAISYALEYISYMYEDLTEDQDLSIFCLQPQYKLRPDGRKETFRGSLYDLPYAKMEVDSISSIFTNRVVSVEKINKNQYQQFISRSTIFHFAGHAIINSNNAYLALIDTSGLELRLTGKEVGLMRHQLEMVVLSACETGLGKLEAGEGIRSLGRSFMESGAKSTIISLWNVNDQSTAKIMTRFYRYLSEGFRKSDALRLAKLDYMRSHSNGKNHPYFWAAFIPAGDMDPLIIRS